MNISELFESIQDNLQDILKGEFELDENRVIWTYTTTENGFEPLDEFDEENDMFGFETQTTEELLIETYNDDIEKLEEHLDELGEEDNWEISEFEVNENKISFYVLPENQ